MGGRELLLEGEIVTKHPDGSVTFTAQEHAAIVMQLEFAAALAEKILAQQQSRPAPGLLERIAESLLFPGWRR
jgi:hypothetical protein